MSKSWFTNEDVVAFEELIGRLRRLKESLGFITNRVIAVQAGLDSWQSEQINRKLYYLSFLSMIFLPLSIVTGGNFFPIAVFRYLRLITNLALNFILKVSIVALQFLKVDLDFKFIKIQVLKFDIEICFCHCSLGVNCNRGKLNAGV